MAPRLIRSDTRQHPRFVPTVGWELFLESGTGDRARVHDISAGGAFFRPMQPTFVPTEKCHLRLVARESATATAAPIGPATSMSVSEVSAALETFVAIDLEAAIDRARPVLRFVDETIVEYLSRLEATRQLTRNQEEIHTTREPAREAVNALIAAIEKGPLEDAKELAVHVREWIDANRRSLAMVAPDAWPLVLESLRTTFSTDYYIGEQKFENYVNAMIRPIVQRGGFDEYDVVPMRMLAGVSSILGRHLKNLPGINWRESLWSFLTRRETADGKRRCLIAVDSYVSEGQTRRQFLRTLAANEEICKRYQRVVLAAVVSRQEPQLDDDVLDTLKGFGVEVITASGHQVSGFPVDHDFRIFGGSPVPGGLQHGPVVFYYGVPYDTPPFYWQDDHRWTPLFKPLSYYSPNYRPIARAPFFEAHERTLTALKGRVALGGVAVLYSERGDGKTYVAARLAEVTRGSSYVFWHRCRPLDAIGSLVESLDAFLMTLGIDIKLVGIPYAADRAARLVAALRQLDRPPLLILDGAENLLVKDDRHGPSVPVFVRHLVEALRREPAGPVVSPPFLLLTDMRAPWQENQLGQVLVLPDEDCIHCPVPDDQFLGAVELARRLINDGEAFQKYHVEIDMLSTYIPYKTWLLSYWINRCTRRHHGLTEAAIADIEKVVNPSLFPGGRLRDLHEAIRLNVTRDEQMALVVMAAWNLPWSVAELDEVMRRQGVEGAEEIVRDMLADRAPFLVKLGSPQPPQSRLPFASVPAAGSEADQRYEMPAVAIAFFLDCLKQADNRAEVFLALADTNNRRLEALASRQDAASRVQVASLRCDGIAYLCDADHVGDAADILVSEDFYRRLRELNATRSLTGLAQRILMTADHAENFPHGHAAPPRPVLSAGQRCAVSAVWADTEANSFNLATAQQICSRARALAAGMVGVEQQLDMIEAKCLRYGNDYRTAIERLSGLRQQLTRQIADQSASESDRHDARARLGRVLSAIAQCEMALGHLDLAGEAVNAIDDAAQDTAASHRARGLKLRHEGTIHLLAGSLDRAAESFAEYRAHIRTAPADSQPRLEAIADFKQARLLVEYVRRWEPVLDADAALQQRLKMPGDLRDQMRKAQQLLEDARARLHQRAVGERKWLPAIDIARTEANLIAQRSGLGEPAASLNDLASQMQLLQGDIPGGAFEVRRKEVDLMAHALAWQAQRDERVALRSEGFVRKLIDELKPHSVADEWNSWVNDKLEQPLDNPFKLSRIDYERMYYLRSVLDEAPPKVEKRRGVPPREEIVEAAAAAYRRGTALLYWSGMAPNAIPLHHLALRCFDTGHLGLQERLEARTCLAALGEEPGVPFDADWIEEILDLIAVEAVRAAAHDDSDSAADDFFTIPIKVMCRFAGRRDLYEEVCVNRRTPELSLSIKAIADKYVGRAAQRLAVTCHSWYRRVSRDEKQWDELANRAAVVPSLGVHRAQIASAAMKRWFDDALVS